MVQRQRENLAKHPCDLSKIVFAATVVGNLIDPEHLNVVILLLGAAISWMLLE